MSCFLLVNVFLNAEIYCLLKVAEGHFSYRSCKDINNVTSKFMGIVGSCNGAIGQVNN